MATLEEALHVDISKMHRIENPDAADSSRPNLKPDLSPYRNPMMRCPMPPVSVTPDSLRQFYKGGIVPEYRLLAPAAAITGNTANKTTVIQTTVVQGTTSTSSSSSSSSAGVVQVASTSTPVLSPGDQFQGTLQMAISFDVMQVTVSNAARVRLYSTANAQLADASRGQVAPAAGIQHGVILDLWLDTPDKYSWNMSPVAPGANADSPQASTIYVTIDGVGSLTDVVTLTILYEVS